MFQSFLVGEPNLFLDHCLIRFSFYQIPNVNEDTSCRTNSYERNFHGYKLCIGGIVKSMLTKIT